MPQVLPDLTQTAQAVQRIQAEVADPRELGERAGEYTEAVMAHGAAVRAHAVRVIEGRWDAHGCGDEALAAADTRMQEAEAKAAGTAYDSPQRREADAAWQEVKDLWERRRRIYVEAVADVLGGQREMGRTPGNLVAAGEMLPADRSTLERVMSRVPREILTAAEGSPGPGGRPSTELVFARNGKPGTAGTFKAVPATTTVALTRVMSMKDLERGSPGKEIEHRPGGVPDLSGETGKMLPATADNRRKMESAIALAVKNTPALREPGNLPEIVESDGRLGIVVPAGTREKTIPGVTRYEIGHDGTEAGMARGMGRYMADRLPGVGVPMAEFAGTRGGTPQGHSGTFGGTTGTSRGQIGTPHGHSGTSGVPGMSPGDHRAPGGSPAGLHRAGTGSTGGYTPREAGEAFAEGMSSVLGGARGGMLGNERSALESTRGGPGSRPTLMNTHGGDSGEFDIIIGLLFLLTGSFLLPW